MTPPPARLLLYPNRARSATIAALVLMAAYLPVGCLLPPDGESAKPANIPPEVDYSALSPSEPSTEISVLREDPTSCRFEFSARVRDRDDKDEVLAVRWVANNRESNAELLGQSAVRVPRDEAGNPTWTQARISLLWPSFGQEAIDTSNTVSLFIIESNDRIDWVVSEQEAQNHALTSTNDYGAVKSLEDAGVESPIEVRWFVTFNQGGCGR